MRGISESGSFVSYLGSLDDAWWFYAVLVISGLEVLLVAYPIETSSLLVLRVVFGLGLLGFLPGYCTARILFPDDQLSDLEQILLSIFFSVMISIAFGVILGIGYRFTGVSSVILSTGYTWISGVAAAYRRYSFLRASSSAE
jgi:uncharacterized membrane protein